MKHPPIIVYGQGEAAAAWTAYLAARREFLSSPRPKLRDAVVNAFAAASRLFGTSETGITKQTSRIRRDLDAMITSHERLAA